MGPVLPAAVRRVAVLGDIGGQLAVFERALADLGVDPVSGLMPPDLAVVQVGDLVRIGGRGLDGDGCVAAAAALRAANPERWIQLFGNHDLMVIGGPARPNWPAPSCAPGTIDRLRRWWIRRDAWLAAAFGTAEYGEVLITHAGLSRGLWVALGRPASPRAAAAELNSDVGRPVASVIRGGVLSGADPGPEAATVDVAWTEVVTELYQPWLDAGDAPFSQIHGHASPWNWSTGSWWPAATADVRAATDVDHATRRTATLLVPSADRPRLAISVDWTLGDRPTTTTWPVLVLTRTP
jgi:hypothetical protein